MATKAEVDEYQRVIDGLSMVAYAQIKALLQSLDNPNPITFRDALLKAYPELMRPYLQAASEVAATWYTTLRVNAGLPSRFLPILAPMPPDEQLEAEVRYSLTPLFAPAEVVTATVLALLAGASQKLIANMGRDTISGSALADPTRTGYARIPRAGCCAFCAMLASRGGVYNSAEAAGVVIGRGVDASETAGKRGGQGKGVKVRGVQGLGNSFHNHCRCVVTPIFVGADNSYAAYTQEFFTEQYAQTGGLVENADGYLVTDMKATLASWRQEHGTR